LAIFSILCWLDSQEKALVPYHFALVEFQGILQALWFFKPNETETTVNAGKESSR
jgi:hypothetical protein